MVNMYRCSLIGTRLLYKIRHHKGHGIHSPFVFNLINNVIEEEFPYYSYQEISDYLSQYKEKDLAPNKFNLLAFRLVNYFSAKTILEIGSGEGVNTLYLTAPSRETECTCIELDKQKFKVATSLYKQYGRNIVQKDEMVDMPNMTFDCIYLDLDNYNSLYPTTLDKLIAMCHEKSFIVVKGIRTNKKQNKLWRCLKENSNRTAELDLFDAGLLFFDKQLYRWKYQISF